MTQDELKTFLHYDPITGLFTWLIDHNFGRSRIGQIAGSLNHGYIQIKIFGEVYLAHRLAFLYMTGKWPKVKADHKDLNRANNKWENLREADNKQNGQNKLARSDSQTGYKGVKITSSGKYQARIKIAGKYKNLGVFVDIEDAAGAYAIAAEIQYGEFAKY